tara:strand:- start:1052 stop:1186 length:135 start_codon:yes stop_codon:yes gene_type:complete
MWRLDMASGVGYDVLDVFSDADTRRFIVPDIINNKGQEVSEEIA